MIRPDAGPQAYALVDLDAIVENVELLRQMAGRAEVMAVVKADAYSHGLIEVARAALAGGASRLGVAVIDEALALRVAGITAPVFAWLAAPGADFVGAIRRDVELAAHSTLQLDEVAAAAAAAGCQGVIHLKVDTGMGRGGVRGEQWRSLCRRARSLEREGLIRVEGIWSHLACADQSGDAMTRHQLAAFVEACDLAVETGLRPAVRHIANSAATLRIPESRLDMVRPGLAIYGVDPAPHEPLSTARRLRPAMSLRAKVAHVRDVPAGTAVSYGATYTTTTATKLAIVPLGYADGVPRAASGSGPVQVAGRRFSVAGRVCMDQFVVDVPDSEVHAGDEVVLFGDGRDGQPTIQDWSDAAGTIAYEVLVRIGGRAARIHTRNRA